MSTISNPLKVTAIVTNTQEINDVIHLLKQTQSQGYTGEITVQLEQRPEKRASHQAGNARYSRIQGL